jgi:DNA replication ATP-dependent helicase Dna2
MRVRDESGAFRRILLRDSWVQSTPVLQGAVVHVIGDFDDEDICVVDNQRNYIVVNPDVLVSATTVADSVGCMRKAVLQDRVKATSDISKPMVYGNIIHTLFQAALEGHDFSTAALHSHIDRIVSNNIESLYLLREEIADAIAYVRAKVPLLQEWAKIFLSARPTVCFSLYLSQTSLTVQYNATVADHRGRGAPKIAINKLLDIEEHIWAPSYGLKGNIDATVQAIVIERDGKDRKTLAMPLELKTGRNTQATAHRAQTMLYTLLMSDRYDMDVQNGLLYYMETAEMMRIPAVRNELRELISKRNQVAAYMHIRESLPEMLRDDYACSRCYAKTPCFVYHKVCQCLQDYDEIPPNVT